MESAELRGLARALAANRGHGGAACLPEAAADAGREEEEEDSKWIVNIELARRICKAKAPGTHPGASLIPHPNCECRFTRRREPDLPGMQV